MIHLGWLQIVLLMLIPVGAIFISLVMKLGLTKDLSISTIRSLVQLVAVGFVIGWVFEQNTWYFVLGLLTVMTIVAGYTAGRRSGAGMTLVFSMVLAAVTAVTLVYISQVVLRLHAWSPRYLIPLGGMLLGNGMTGAVLGVERLLSDLKRRANEVEVMLAMGASPHQAVADLRRDALRAAMMPTINTMLIVGIIQLPGMMTGQMLGGTPPLQAAMYQLLILFGIVFVAGLSALSMILVMSRKLFTEAWQLNRERLTRFTKT